MMLGILLDAGHEIVEDENEAEVIVVNTCAFIKDAKMESIETLIEMASHKKNAKCKYLIAAGCLAQRYKDELLKEIPEVDAIIGNQGFDNIAKAIEDLEKKQEANYMPALEGMPVCGYRRVVTGPSHYAYLKIAEGCDKRCTYCIIPSIRGRYRSIPMETLLKEAEDLAGRGVVELILIAQETTLYGLDLYGKKTLPELLVKLAAIEGIKKIRLQYCYPEEITDELIDVMAKESKICHYIDMPLQSCSDNVLIKMGRKAREAEIRETVNKLRTRIPDICIRTTLISGFPGERRKDQLTTLKCVKDIRFDRLGVFTYSPEEGTPAVDFKRKVPEFIKTFRKNEIMKAQQKIAFAKARDMIGEKLDAIIEGRLVEDGVYVGRTYRDAPDVDGYVFIESERDLLSGDIINIEVTGAKGYDLVAKETI